MQPVLIVIDSPRFNLLSGIVERHKTFAFKHALSRSPEIKPPGLIVESGIGPDSGSLGRCVAVRDCTSGLSPG